MALDKNRQIEAINYFIRQEKDGEAWRKALFNAPAYAMERIAIAMFYSYFKHKLSQEEKEEYRAIREEIDANLDREDLEYLIKVMPPKQKKHYQALLSLMPPLPENLTTPSQQQATLQTQPQPAQPVSAPPTQQQPEPTTAQPAPDGVQPQSIA